MNEWLDFVSSYATPSPSASSSHLSMVALTQHTILEVKGRDAATFLQGQLTCDIRRLVQQDLLLGAHCNAKGRMISSFVIAQTRSESIGLRVRANIAEPALAALKKYIVFSKATIAAADQVAFAVVGGDVTGLPLGGLPERGKTAARDEYTLLHHHSGLLEIWAAPAKAMELWQQLLPFAPPGSVHEVERHWVEHGIADVQAATTEEFIPQMFNYHLVDGISFKKGCYTGQEIVARMQYKGQLKKQIYRIVGDSPEGPAVGEELAAEGDPTKTAAMVVAGAEGAVPWTGLVVAPTEIRGSGGALEAKNTAAKFTWSDLPYAIP